MEQALTESTTSSGRGLSLSRCQRVMAASMRTYAPSLSTLQRDATAGFLAACEVPTPGKCRRYDVERLKQHYAKWKNAPAHGRAPRPPAVNELELSVEAIDIMARAIAEPMHAELAKIAKQVSALSAVRTSLMLKYDATASLTQERAELLAKQLGEARKLADLDIRVAKLTREVSRLADLLDQRPASAA